jgi:HK97 family phage major capsid protein
MGDIMLVKLREDREAKLKFAEDLANTAASENRDLSTNELEIITRTKDRVEEIDKQLVVLTRESTLDEESQNKLAKLAGAAIGSAASPVEYRTAGQYLTDYISTLIGEGESRTKAEDRLRRYHRAAAHVTTGNFTGVFPDPIVGTVISLINTSRPLVSALGTTPVPAGPSFRRPRLNDPDVATGMGVQANEKDELVSKAFTLSSENVDLSTLGGYVNVARQVLDWGIASMDTVVNQLAGRYSYATERMAIAELAKSTSKVPLASTATSAEVLAAVYDAAALVFAQTNQLPTILAAGPNGWARMGGLSSTTGVPTFPLLAPNNAIGSMSGANTFEGNPVGLRLVVTPAITDESMWVLNGLALEIYEQVNGQLSVVEPSVLGIQVSYSGYVGYYRPAANGAVLIAP